MCNSVCPGLSGGLALSLPRKADGLHLTHLQLPLDRRQQLLSLLLPLLFARGRSKRKLIKLHNYKHNHTHAQRKDTHTERDRENNKQGERTTTTTLCT